MKFVLASQNRHKLEEMRSILSAHGVEVGPAHRPKPRPKGQPVGQIDLVLPLVPVWCHRHHILSMEGL